jgi:hypothetical protein
MLGVEAKPPAHLQLLAFAISRYRCADIPGATYFFTVRPVPKVLCNKRYRAHARTLRLE